MEKIYLMTPIFELYSIKSMNEAVFTIGFSEYLKNQHGLEERIEIYEGLKWAENKPNYDFKSIMDTAPVARELSFSNEEIYNYLMNYKTFMENEDYSLLTDDRPPIER